MLTFKGGRDAKGRLFSVGFEGAVVYQNQPRRQIILAPVHGYESSYAVRDPNLFFSTTEHL